MTAEELEAGKLFGRYLDVDDDGIAYRTLPGTHPTKGAFFTRGTSKDRMARYSEEGQDYQENMERLLKKHQHRAGHGAARRSSAKPMCPTQAWGDLLWLHQSGDQRGGVVAGGPGHPSWICCGVRGFPFGAMRSRRSSTAP